MPRQLAPQRTLLPSLLPWKYQRSHFFLPIRHASPRVSIPPLPKTPVPGLRVAATGAKESENGHRQTVSLMSYAHSSSCSFQPRNAGVLGLEAATTTPRVEKVAGSCGGKVGGRVSLGRTPLRRPGTRVTQLTASIPALVDRLWATRGGWRCWETIYSCLCHWCCGLQLDWTTKTWRVRGKTRGCFPLQEAWHVLRVYKSHATWQAWR